jgi:sec-independent protein translocase protein TatC
MPRRLASLLRLRGSIPRNRSRPPNLPIPPQKHNRYFSTLASDDIGGSVFPRDDEETRMPLLEHLKELRVRVIRSAIAIALGFVIAYAIDDWLFAVLTQPLREAAHGKLLLIGTGVGEAFYTKLKVALIAGLFIASPAVFYEVWKFIVPGLYETERRMAKPFVVSASLFFAAGGYFCWAVVFKIGYSFFLNQYASIGVTPTIRISEYLAFSAKLLLAFGITFEMPIFAFFLTRLGLVDYRMMIHHLRYAILGIFIVAVALTPPDMVSPFLLAIPLLALYGLSIGVSYAFRVPANPVGDAAEGPQPT